MSELVKDLEALQAIAYSGDCVMTKKGYDLLEQIINREKAKPEEDRKDLLRLWELEALIGNPEINDFLEGVKLEAAHQTDKWGNQLEHWPHDFSLVLDKLKGKQALSIWAEDLAKYKHHLVTMAAVCFNAHTKLDNHKSNMYKHFHVTGWEGSKS